MSTKTLFVAVIFLLLTRVNSFGQCGDLLSDYSLSFSTDQVCAPVTVNNFEITYKFLSPQDPTNIAIVFNWRDPDGNITMRTLGDGLTAAAGPNGANTVFTATAAFTYVDHNECVIQPTVSLWFLDINQECTSSITQTPPAFFWDNDEGGNGTVAMAPQVWDVCFNNPVTDARFRDASEFNCNPNIEPDHPNIRERHVQFIYGTNLGETPTIRDLSLSDGSGVVLTDANGDFVGLESRGAGLTLEGAHFGDIETVPMPAEGPVSVSLPMSAPPNTLNEVGTRFRVTMVNWNFCNPWNGNVASPNYEDAIITYGFVEIVDAPEPDFLIKDASGVARASFCIGEDIHFDNTTTGANGYTWEFYDNPDGTGAPAHTSTATHPVYAFSTGGSKLVRLIAENSTAQSACVETIEALVSITPALAAKIGVTDLADQLITPDFCQEYTGTLADFPVRFHDLSEGTVTATTQWRWEFYDENNTVVRREPASGFSSTPLGPFDEVFTTPGIYRVVLYIRDQDTGCETMDETRVRVFEKPQPVFTFSRVCDGAPVTFSDASVVDAIDGEEIVAWEWDMGYDGVTFDKDPALDNRTGFDYTFGGPGAYDVALRVMTNTGACEAIAVQTVTVDALPLADFTADLTSGCSVLRVTLTNEEASGQPAEIDRFVWEVDEGSGFVADSVQRPGDPDFSNTYIRQFRNIGLVDRAFQVRLRAVTVGGCETVSPQQTITVHPQPRAGFVSLNYSPFDDNCTPVSVDFRVDDETTALNPTDYTWQISDANGIISEISTGTTPTFSYDFSNNTQSMRDFFVRLRATLPSACYGDSTRTVRVAPSPSSGFAADTVTYACDQVLLELNAVQKGLSQYNWNIDINGVVVYNNTTEDDILQYAITRSSTLDQLVTLSLRTRNLTNCESALTTRTVLIKRTDVMNTSFRAEPAEQTLPASTVTIINETHPGPWSYHWDFGDGTTSTDPDVSSHVYDTFGEYTITLTVENDDCVESVSRAVKINPIPPVLAFDYFPPRGCAPLTVSFINESRYADPTTYFWQFGAGEGTSRAIDPSYTYLEPGLYSVTLSATNLLGDTVSLTKEMIIEVLPNPVAKFAVYPTTPLNVPGETLYTSNRSLNASEYMWDFGDGHTSTDPEPQHLYAEEGTYTITLIARNGDGCADTTVLASGVHAVNHGQLLIPNAFIPNAAGPGRGDVRSNEVFMPIVQKVTRFRMLIFNRWGQLLFESDTPEVGWDGYYNGRLCAQDVYIYRITAEYENGRTITRTGDVNLLR